MFFIDKFLDVTAPLPKEIERFLKLYKTIEECCKDNDIKLDRDKYLQKLKEKEIKTNDLTILKDKIVKIEQIYKETLSDYKQKILTELNYIFEKPFLNKITQIIEEGQKECHEQIISNPNSFYNKIINDDLKNISENDKEKKNDILGKK